MDIVCHAFPAWEGNYLKSTVQLMSELAREHRVLYVDYAYTWKDFFQSVRGQGFANWRRMLGWQSRLRAVTLDNGATLHVLTLPPVFPANFIQNPDRFDAVNAVNTRLFIRPAILWALKKLNMRNPSVVNAFNPFFGVHLAGRLGEKQLIYYCYDEISAATWASRHGERLEQAFMKMVDTVIVSSRGLFERKSRAHFDCRLVKNGVDYALFAQDIADADLPTVPNHHGQKIVGYLGSIDERLDYDLIDFVVEATPQYLYVFVGRVPDEATQKRLARHANVRLMGAQPPATLPAWVNRFDVCLIPFLRNELTSGIYPLKINEYLAAGKSVVATRFGDMRDFERYVTVANHSEDFLAGLIEAAATAPSDSIVVQRHAFAAQNSWRTRAQEFAQILQQAEYHYLGV